MSDWQGRDGPPPEDRTPVDETAPLLAHKWLVLRASAVLESVATKNYVTYRGQSVPRYPLASGNSGELLAALKVGVTLSTGDETPIWSCRELVLTHRESSPQQVFWRGYDRARHLQVAWIWDFYRIQSHVMLRTELCKHNKQPVGAWAEVVAAFRAASPEDSLRLAVASPVGDIRQQHTLDSAAMTWSP